MDNRRTRRKKTQRPAGLGFKAMKTFVQNQDSVEGFIDELEAGTLDLTRFSVGRVAGAVGSSHFDVIQLPSGIRVASVGIAGFLKGGSHAAGTHIDRDSIVILYDSRTGPMNRGRTHTIMGVLAPHQVDHVFPLLGIRMGDDDDLFERTENAAAVRAEVAMMRAGMEAMRRSAAVYSSSSNDGSVAASRKSSSSSINLETEMAAAANDARREKKRRQTKRRMAARKAAAATGAAKLF